jgi:small subunit ribosomal protein S20
VAHSLSAKKRIRQNEKRRARNRARKGAMRTQIKKLETTVREGSDLTAIDKTLRDTQKNIDKVAAKGSIHKNTASRQKARLARLVNKARAGRS